MLLFLTVRNLSRPVILLSALLSYSKLFQSFLDNLRP